MSAWWLTGYGGEAKESVKESRGYPSLKKEGMEEDDKFRLGYIALDVL